MDEAVGRIEVLAEVVGGKGSEVVGRGLGEVLERRRGCGWKAMV